MKQKKPTYAELERKLLEATAQTTFRLKEVDRTILKAGDSLMASACIIGITALGGREIVQPFAVHDGLSPDTIEALRRDIQRTLQRLIK